MKSTTPQTEALRCQSPDFEAVFALAEHLETQVVICLNEVIRLNGLLRVATTEAREWEQRARSNAKAHNETEDERFRLQEDNKRLLGQLVTCRSTLSSLDHKVHSGYDFNADPLGITKEVGDCLAQAIDD